MAQARRAELYSELGVADTLDGRFDMIILHNDAVMYHMQAGDDRDRVFAQALIDELFRDMDRSLREMGVGDMGVGKRVKKMATVYYGRANGLCRVRVPTAKCRWWRHWSEMCLQVTMQGHTMPSGLPSMPDCCMTRLV